MFKVCKPEKNSCHQPKVGTNWQYNRMICLLDANSKDPDHNASKVVPLEEQSDLGLQLLPRHICTNAKDHKDRQCHTLTRSWLVENVLSSS